MVLAGTEIHILNMTRAYCYTLQKRRYPLVLGVKLVWWREFRLNSTELFKLLFLIQQPMWIIWVHYNVETPSTLMLVKYEWGERRCEECMDVDDVHNQANQLL